MTVIEGSEIKLMFAYNGQTFHGNKNTYNYHNCKTVYITIYEGWNFNSGNYLFTNDTK